MDKNEFKSMFKNMVESGEIDVILSKNLFGSLEVRIHMDGKCLEKKRPEGYYEDVHNAMYGL